VLGCGLDIPYPSGNQALFETVAQRGMMVSEFSLGARPESWRFPARNRIISGISRATVVVEAAEKSGAIITAGLAGVQGREVMAVPGQVNSPKSRGCHALIRDGATLVENAEQVMEALGWGSMAREAPATVTPELPMDQGMLLLALREGQKHLDELTSECGLSPAQAGAAVTLLEMRGLVRRVPGNHYVRV
nr:DNA-protecting protein DprA [Armatimonadota bacterium]